MRQKRNSLKKKLLMQIGGPAFISVALLVFGYFMVEPATRKLMVNQRQEAAKDMVVSTYNMIRGLNQRVVKGEITLQQAQSLVLNIIHFERYGKDNLNYLWIQDYNGKLIYHPVLDSMAKVNPDVVEVIHEVALKVSEVVKQKGEGVFSYTWYPLQGPSLPSPKEAFVKGYQPWGWIIGTGFMIQDIQNDLQTLTKEVLGSLALFLGCMLSILAFALVRNYYNLQNIKVSGEELEKREKRFRTFVEHIESGLLIYENGIPVYSNANFESLLGGFHKGLASFELEQFLPEWEKIRVNQLTMQTDAPNIQFTTWIKTTTGKDKYVSANLIQDKESGPTNKYLLLKDITEQQQIAATIDMLSENLAQSSDSVVITDLHGNIEYVNRGFEKSTGYSFEEVKGKNPRIMKSNKMRPIVYKDLWETVSAGNIWRGEILNRKKDGTLFWEATTIFPIKNKQNEIIKYSSIKRDITQNKAIEKQLLIAKEKAEENERLKSAFLNNISHEVRTPLNAVYGFTQLLKENLDGTENKSYLDLMEHNCEVLINLFDDIIDYSHIESRAIQLNKEDVKLKNLIDEVIAGYNRQTSTSGKMCVEIVLESQPGFNDMIIFTDVHRLKQIFEKILDNALKYTIEGSIRISYDLDYDNLTFHITDTGVGISEKEKELIFGSFIHGENLEVSLHKGVGLGLNIARRLVEMLGGTFSFASSVGKGSTFSFSLPTIDLKNHSLNGEAVMLFQNTVRGLKILVAEDNDENFIYLDAILGSANVLARAKTGLEAVRMIESAAISPDIVLMDILMPEMDGVDACRLIRRVKPGIPVVGISAIGNQLNAEKRNLFDDIVNKPIKVQELFAKIQRLTNP
ncbi:MAG TPA: PAS domain S-box protein [Bacteroidales bacterium]|nr:PAS domain S-box protein [Bacteroidales bacterium]